MGGDVQVNVERPGKQSRLKVFFRFILLIPLYIMLIGVGIVGAILIFLNYFIVLITGRPAFVGFLSGVLRFITRVTAYAYFLTDEYPPFSLGEASGYAVQVEVPPPGKIHRWRFFSYFLAIPHILVLYGLGILAAICTLIAWVCLIITARYPVSIRDREDVRPLPGAAQLVPVPDLRPLPAVLIRLS
jgi:hypothetical protein